MTTEPKTRKNPDYSQSIVNQKNPDEVKVELSVLYQLQLEAEELRATLENLPVFKEWTAACGKATEQIVKVKAAIEGFGSYQDVENGVYGLKYSRATKSYHAEPFSKHFEKYAAAVIEPTINVKALEGLIKGKLISEGAVIEHGVITETQTFAYYIK